MVTKEKKYTCKICGKGFKEKPVHGKPILHPCSRIPTPLFDGNDCGVHFLEEHNKEWIDYWNTKVVNSDRRDENGNYLFYDDLQKRFFDENLIENKNE
jgi:hypothetical protein